MLKSVSIENYRNLESLCLDNLGRINLIAGKNGSGKTALLEALWLFSGPDVPELAARVDAFRGHPPMGPDNLFHSIFHDFDPDKEIRLRAGGDWGSSTRELKIRIQERSQATTTRSQTLGQMNPERLTRSQDEGEYEILFDFNQDQETYESRAWWVSQPLAPDAPGPIQAIVNEGIRQERQRVRGKPNSIYLPTAYRDNVQTVATRYGQLELDGRSDLVMEFIRPLEPRLRGITTVAIRDVPVVHANLEGMKSPMPMRLLGEGLNQTFQLALALSDATGGIVLVDEIENGIHHSVQHEVFAGLHRLAEAFDVQVFATTHSDECIRAAHGALWELGDQEFTYYRLDRVNGQVKVATFGAEKRETAFEHNMEIR